MFRSIFLTVFWGGVLILITSLNNEPATNYEPAKNLTFIFYNTENLFDIVNNQGTRDGDFTPDGKYKWTKERYQKKLADVSRVLCSVNKQELPEIIGLCETENRNVLNDLVKTGTLAKGNYHIVQYESPDYRGIDCSLLYRPDEFSVTESHPVPVNCNNEPEFTTRDILYVKGKTNNNETWHIFINHWPSRTGGIKQTEEKRLVAARTLKQKTDSLFLADPESNIVIMGDMNDEPSDKSLVKILNAQKPGLMNARLVNLMFPLHLKNKGSYFYKGNWDMLDNIIVSKSLLDNNGYSCTDRVGFVFRDSWMEKRNENGQSVPGRTYNGLKYSGGASDHFPVYFRLCR